MQIGLRGKRAEKARGIAESPLDFLLMPAIVHRRISRRTAGLPAAFLVVGFCDVLLFQNLLRAGLFTGGFGNSGMRLVALSALAFAIGALDVVCVMWPVADFARFLAHRSERFISGGIHVILMKSYALSHLLFILPTVIFVYNPVDWNTVPATWSTGAKLEFSILAAILQVLPLIQLGIVFRTLRVRSKLEPVTRVIILAALFFWMQLAGEMILRLTAMGLAWILQLGQA